MTALFAQWTLDVHDVDQMARFWSEALGYRVDRDDDGNVHLCPARRRPAGDAHRLAAGQRRLPSGTRTATTPTWWRPTVDVEAEVERLVALGARHVDVGQTPDDPFVVLADPEGNEFCVLRRLPRRAPR